MDIAPPPGQYQRPPRRWPFPSLGRTGFLLIGLALLALALLPFWGSIAVASIFAFGLHRPAELVAARLGSRRRLVAAGTVVALTLLLCFPAAWLGVRTAQVVTEEKASGGGVLSGETMNRAREAYSQLERYITQYGVGARVFESTADARNSIREAAGQVATKAAQMVPVMVGAMPELFLTFFVFCLFLYTFLSYPAEIKQIAVRSNLIKRNDLDRAVQILQASSYNSLVANFLVGLMQATIITVGARAVGYKESVLIFSLVFALSYIPFIGSAPTGYLLAIISLILDNTVDAVVMATVATFAGVVDNFVRPYLVSNGQSEVHPVLTFAAIIGSIGVFGLKGLFLGPVIVTATVAFLGTTVEGQEVEGANAEKAVEQKAG